MRVDVVPFPLQVAVCNLASISLKAFAKQEDGATGKDAFDHQKLFEITKVRFHDHARYLVLAMSSGCFA